MKVLLEDVSSVKKRIVVEVPPEDIGREIDVVYRELGAKIAIDGFRKGKVPKAILESRYKDYVMGEVASKLVENSYPKIIKEKNLSPVSRPLIDVKGGIEEGQSFSYTATVEVRPVITAQDYIGMQIKKEEISVSEADVKNGVEMLRERNAYFSEVERPVREMDMVIVDFECFEDGKPIKDMKASEYPAEIGTNTLIPELENALKGVAKGEEKEVTVKFPDKYHNKELAGKDVLFRVKVKAVKEKISPALDDEFAKDLKFNDINHLRDEVRKDIVRHKKAEERERLKGEILAKLVAVNSFDIPPALVSNYAQTFVSRALEEIKKGRIKPEDAGDISPEKLQERYTKIAETRVREELIMDAVARQEGITVSEEEIDLKMKELAAGRYQRFGEFKKKLLESGADRVVTAGILEDKVFDLIIEKAKIEAIGNRQ